MMGTWFSSNFGSSGLFHSGRGGAVWSGIKQSAIFKSQKMKRIGINFKNAKTIIFESVPNWNYESRLFYEPQKNIFCFTTGNRSKNYLKIIC